MLGGTSSGSAHPFVDLAFVDQASQSGLTMRIPGIASGTYTETSTPKLSATLSDPSFTHGTPLPAGQGVPTGDLSHGYVRLTSQGKSVSGHFDLTFAFSPLCSFCKPTPPVLANAIGDFGCTPTQR